TIQYPSAKCNSFAIAYFCQAKMAVRQRLGGISYTPLCRGWDGRRELSVVLSIVLPAFANQRLLESIAAREALQRQPPGIGAVAAAVRQLLERERESPAGGVGPRQSVLCREGPHVR